MPGTQLIRAEVIAPKAHQERHIVFWLHRTAPCRRSLERGYQRGVDKTSTVGRQGEEERGRQGDKEKGRQTILLVSPSPCLLVFLSMGRAQAPRLRRSPV